MVFLFFFLLHLPASLLLHRKSALSGVICITFNPRGFMELLHKGGLGYLMGTAQTDPCPHPGCFLGRLCTLPPSWRDRRIFREVQMALPRMLLVLGWAGTENPAGQPASQGRLNKVN